METHERTRSDSDPADSTEVVQNLGSLPDGWTDRYEVAVLCRALWSLDYLKADMLWAMFADKPGPNFGKTS